MGVLEETMIRKKHPDGTITIFDNALSFIIYRKYPDGVEEIYNPLGQVTFRKFSEDDERCYRYNEDGICIYERFKNKNEYRYNTFGKVIYKKLNNVETWYEYNEKNLLIRERNSKGIIIEYVYNKDDILVYTQRYEHGKLVIVNTVT